MSVPVCPGGLSTWTRGRTSVVSAVSSPVDGQCPRLTEAFTADLTLEGLFFRMDVPGEFEINRRV